MTGTLRVDPDKLKASGAAFKSSASDISGLSPDAPVSDAAGVGASLKTADACRTAATTIADQNTATANQLTEFASNITNAAVLYQTHDQAAAGKIASVHPGG